MIQKHKKKLILNKNLFLKMVIRLQKEEAGTWSIIITLTFIITAVKILFNCLPGQLFLNQICLLMCSNTTRTHTHTHTQNVEKSHVSQSGIIKPSVNFPAYMRIVLVCVGVFWEPICEMSSNSVIFIFNHTCHFLELPTRSHLFMVLYHINTS